MNKTSQSYKASLAIWDHTVFMSKNKNNNNCWEYTLNFLAVNQNGRGLWGTNQQLARCHVTSPDVEFSRTRIHERLGVNGLGRN